MSGWIELNRTAVPAEELFTDIQFHEKLIVQNGYVRLSHMPAPEKETCVTIMDDHCHIWKKEFDLSEYSGYTIDHLNSMGCFVQVSEILDMDGQVVDVFYTRRVCGLVTQFNRTDNISFTLDGNAIDGAILDAFIPDMYKLEPDTSYDEFAGLLE